MPQYSDGLLGTTEPVPILDAIERTQARWGGGTDLLELQAALAITGAVQVAGPQGQVRGSGKLCFSGARRSNFGHAGLGGRQPVEPGAHNGRIRDTLIG